MYKVTVKSVRPNIQDNFFRYDDDMYDYIDETYFQTGKILLRETTVSEDLSIETCTTIFNTKADWLEYFKDPVIAYQEPIKVRYNIYHKIAVSTNLEDIVVTKDLYNLYLR